MHRRAFAKLTLAAPALFFARPALASEPKIYQEGGIAIDGSDPVGYFTQNGPVPGASGLTVDYKGAIWRFATQASADAFAANPTAYEPAFGGYCAFAASRGYLAPTTPEAWTIYENRLYLNANLRARELWLQDIPGNIAKGEANWPGILG